MAPNFNKYRNLPQDTAKQIYAKYRKSMDATKTTKGEFRKIIERANEADYKPLNINYEVGKLENSRSDAMRKTGVMDSKIMAADHDLHHSTGHKNAKQKIPENLFDDVYETLQEPEKIFQETSPAHPGQEKIFHLVKEIRGGKKIKIVVHVRTLKTGGTAMQVRTIGYADYDYTGADYDEIKWQPPERFRPFRLRPAPGLLRIRLLGGCLIQFWAWREKNHASKRRIILSTILFD